MLEYNVHDLLWKMGGECVTIEEFIPGAFDNHINNTGDVCGDEDLDTCQKAQCFEDQTDGTSEKQLI